MCLVVLNRLLPEGPSNPKSALGSKVKIAPPGVNIKLYTANVKQTSQMRRNLIINSVQSEVRKETSLSVNTRASFER